MWDFKDNLPAAGEDGYGTGRTPTSTTASRNTAGATTTMRVLLASLASIRTLGAAKRSGVDPLHALRPIAVLESLLIRPAAEGGRPIASEVVEENNAHPSQPGIFVELMASDRDHED